MRSFVVYGIFKPTHFKNGKEGTKVKIVSLNWVHDWWNSCSDSGYFPTKAAFEPDLKRAFALSINASLFSHVLRNLLITAKERLKVYFLSYLETKVSASEAHILCSFTASFRRFLLKFGAGERCPIIPQNSIKVITILEKRMHVYQLSKFNCVPKTKQTGNQNFLDTVFQRKVSRRH